MPVPVVDISWSSAAAIETCSIVAALARLLSGLRVARLRRGAAAALRASFAAGFLRAVLRRAGFLRAVLLRTDFLRLVLLAAALPRRAAADLPAFLRTLDLRAVFFLPRFAAIA